LFLSFLFVDATFDRSIRMKRFSEPDLQMLEMLNENHQLAAGQQAQQCPSDEGCRHKDQLAQFRFADCDHPGQLQTERDSASLRNIHE